MIRIFIKNRKKASNNNTYHKGSNNQDQVSRQKYKDLEEGTEDKEERGSGKIANGFHGSENGYSELKKYEPRNVHHEEKPNSYVIEETEIKENKKNTEEEITEVYQGYDNSFDYSKSKTQGYQKRSSNREYNNYPENRNSNYDGATAENDDYNYRPKKKSYKNNQFQTNDTDKIFESILNIKKESDHEVKQGYTNSYNKAPWEKEKEKEKENIVTSKKIDDFKVVVKYKKKVIKRLV